MRNTHHERKEVSKINPYLKEFGWFLAWTLIYTVLYIVFGFLLEQLFGNTSFYQVKFISILIIGLCFSIASRIIWALLHNKRIYIGSDVFLFWTFAYAFSIWFFEFLREVFIRELNFNFLSNKFAGFLFVGFGVWLIIKLVKRIDFKIRTPRGIRTPSQIASGIILIVLGILCWRFSAIIFLDWFNWAEGMAWSWLIGLALVIGGVLVLKAYWKNNVASFNLHGHWWNH